MPVTTRLTRGRSVPVADLGPARRDEMYRLLEAHFADADRETFERDLDEKDLAILPEDAVGRVVGFSTFEARVRHVLGSDVLVIYSGDTIVSSEHRHQTELPRTFISLAMGAADASPLPAWWLLVCSGYKTYRYLPLFFREFHPSLGADRTDLRAMTDALALARFGERYDAATGIVSLPGASALREGVADVDSRRLADPAVRRFLELNPGHAHGDELACVVRIARDNLTRAGERMVRVVPDS